MIYINNKKIKSIYIDGRKIVKRFINGYLVFSAMERLNAPTIELEA